MLGPCPLDCDMLIKFPEVLIRHNYNQVGEQDDTESICFVVEVMDVWQVSLEARTLDITIGICMLRAMMLQLGLGLWGIVLQGYC